jgi:hypothetical protein
VRFDKPINNQITRRIPAGKRAAKSFDNAIAYQIQMPHLEGEHTSFALSFWLVVVTSLIK